MTNYVKRLVYLDAEEKTKLNPLIWPFILGTFVYGLGFLAFGWTPGVGASSLYATLFDLHQWLPAVWGGSAALTGILAVYCILTRKVHIVSEATAMLGVLVWLFAGFCYLEAGAWLIALTVSAVYCYFWVFWYWRLAWYKRAKAAGLVDAG